MVVLFNKPYGVLSQFTPEAGHRALNEFGFPPGVYAAGRLDHDSEGALLLTDDGRLVKRLLDPKNAHPRTYLAQVDGEITDLRMNNKLEMLTDVKILCIFAPRKKMIESKLCKRTTIFHLCFLPRSSRR